MSAEVERPRPPASMIMTRVGGIDYPLVSIPQCRTCQSKHRLIIENHLIQGRTYTAIYKELLSIDPDNEAHPTVDGLKNHYMSGHMPLQKAVQRRIYERRAEEIGDRYDDEGSLLDHVTVAQMIVQKGGEQIAIDGVTPNVAETLAAAKFLHDIEKDIEESVDNEVWAASMVVYMEEARAIMDDAQWFAFGQRLSNNPVLREIRAKRDAIEANIQEAEVVEDEPELQEQES